MSSPAGCARRRFCTSGETVICWACSIRSAKLVPHICTTRVVETPQKLQLFRFDQIRVDRQRFPQKCLFSQYCRVKILLITSFLENNAEKVKKTTNLFKKLNLRTFVVETCDFSVFLQRLSEVMQSIIFLSHTLSEKRMYFLVSLVMSNDHKSLVDCIFELVENTVIL